MDASDWDRRYAATELVWSASPNVFVEAELADLRPGRAVDVAAGEGRNAIWLAQQGWQVTATDFSQSGLDKGRAIAEHLGLPPPRIEWLCADVLEHDLGTEVFDLAVLAYLQLPADQRRTALRRAFRSLRDAGTLLVVAHDSTNLTEGCGGPQDASVLYTAEDVLADLDGEHFAVVRAERVTRRVPAPEAGTSATEPGHEGTGQEPPPLDGGRTAYDVLVRVTRTPG